MDGLSLVRVGRAGARRRCAASGQCQCQDHNDRTGRSLPWTTMSPSCFCLSLRTWSATSPFRTVELLQVGFVRVDETTYFGMALNLSANSPSLEGQAAANPS